MNSPKKWSKSLTSIPMQIIKSMSNVPRTEFLLHQVKEIESALLDWYKEFHCSNGDSYHVTVTSTGKWSVSHSNDYPMQHGNGGRHILTEKEFDHAMALQKAKKSPYWWNKTQTK